VVLELEAAREGVLEVGVDRRLEGGGELEALLDQQQAVADGRRWFGCTLCGQGRRAARAVTGLGPVRVAGPV